MTNRAQTKARILKLVIVFLALVVVLAACRSAQRSPPTPSPTTGTSFFTFNIDPENNLVELVAPQTGALTPQQATTPGETRVLVNGVDLELASFNYKFKPHKTLEIYASFKNITTDFEFLQPFFFTPSQTPAEGNYKSSTEPTVSDDDLGGDGVLSPGEVTAELTFVVKYRRKRFRYEVEANGGVLNLGFDKPALGTVVMALTSSKGLALLSFEELEIQVNLIEGFSGKLVSGVEINAIALSKGIFIWTNDPNSEHFPSYAFVPYESIVTTPLSRSDSPLSRSDSELEPQFAIVTITMAVIAIVSIGLSVYELLKDPPGITQMIDDDGVRKECITGDINDILDVVSLVTAGATISHSIRVLGAPAKVRGVTAINLGFTKAGRTKDLLKLVSEFLVKAYGPVAELLDRERNFICYRTVSNRITSATTTIPIIEVSSEAPVSVTLPKDSPTTMEVTVDLPDPTEGEVGADVMFVFDRSGSFHDDIATFRHQANNIVTSLNTSLTDLRVGLSSFIDAPCGSFGSSGDFGYELDLALTPATSTFGSTLDSLDIRSGADGPEAQLEAMLQALTGAGYTVRDGSSCDGVADIPPSKPDWQTGRLPFLIVSTDAPFHRPPGSSTSLSTPAATNKDSANYSNGPDPSSGIITLASPPYPYPTNVDDVIREASAKGTTVFFMISGFTDPGATEIANATSGAVFTLGSNSSGIVDAIRDAVGTSITSADVTLVSEGDDAGFVKSIDPTKFSGVDLTKTDTVTFKVTFESSVTPGPEPQTFLFSLILTVDGAEVDRLPVLVTIPAAP